MKTSKLCVTGLYEVNPPVNGGFPSQRASDANVSIWWHDHDLLFMVIVNWQRRKGCHDFFRFPISNNQNEYKRRYVPRMLYCRFSLFTLPNNNCSYFYFSFSVNYVMGKRKTKGRCIHWPPIPSIVLFFCIWNIFPDMIYRCYSMHEHNSTHSHMCALNNPWYFKHTGPVSL